MDYNDELVGRWGDTCVGGGEVGEFWSLTEGRQGTAHGCAGRVAQGRTRFALTCDVTYVTWYSNDMAVRGA